MQYSLVKLRDIQDGSNLSPIRYDPRRVLGADAPGIPLSSLVQLATAMLRPAIFEAMENYVVLDTGDVGEGHLAYEGLHRGAPKSAKKVARPGDLLISRLRPYLRQVGYLEPRAVGNIELFLVSTEFYVLRPIDGQSIAYLAPWLLSETPQRILAASQEGGHHPRFDSAVLLELRVPTDVVATSATASLEIAEAATMRRRSADIVEKWKNSAAEGGSSNN